MIQFGVQSPELRSKTDKIYLKQRYGFERLNQSLPQRVIYSVLTATVWNLQIKLNPDFLQSAIIRKRHELQFSHFVAVKSMWISKGLVQIAEPCRRLLNTSTSTSTVLSQGNKKSSLSSHHQAITFCFISSLYKLQYYFTPLSNHILFYLKSV